MNAHRSARQWLSLRLVTTLGRQTLLWMIPLNLLLIVWVWFGRIVFGVGGWFLLIFMLTVVPVLLIGLLITTILAFTKPGRPRSLTRPQALVQLVTWAGMLLAGTFVPDLVDAVLPPESCDVAGVGPAAATYH